MSHAELMQRARRGDPKAIAQLLHLKLYSRGIRVKTHQAGDRLQILLEAHHFPERQNLVMFLQRECAQLELKTVQSIEIYARHPDTTEFVWCDGFELRTLSRHSSQDRQIYDHPEPCHSQSSIGSDTLNGVDLKGAGSSPVQSPSLNQTNHPDFTRAFSIADMSPAEIARMARARMHAQQTAHPPQLPLHHLVSSRSKLKTGGGGSSLLPKPGLNPKSSRRHTHDWGWLLIEKFKGMNPFASGLMIILTLHSIFGSRHYTPEGFILGRDWMMMFLHNVNLIIHEAGHPIFGIFGEFVGLLGGSLLQILVPTFITGYFFFTQQLFAGAIAFWWIGQNFLDVSLYIKDAQERALPLLGGEAVLHDWHFLLLKTQLLLYDDLIAGIVYSVGILIYVVAIILGFRYAHVRINQSQSI